MSVIERIGRMDFTRAEALKAAELLWSRALEEGEPDSPAWHGEELDSRKARVDAGLEEVSDWEEAKKRITSEFNQQAGIED